MENKTKAIILSAGRGVRLNTEIPKTLINISGKEILGRTLETLRYCGIKDITIVTGFKGHLIVDYIMREEFLDLNIKTIVNNDWETTNNACSLQLALENINDDILVCNADVVCYKDLVKELVNCPYNNAMAVVRKKQLNEEDMKVEIKDEKIYDVSKTIEIQEAYGEFTGIFKINKSYLEYFKNHLNDCIIDNKNNWFESGLNTFCNSNDVFLCDVSHYPYIEIDFPEDLEIARDIFPYNDPCWEQGQHHNIPLNQDLAFCLLKDITELLKNNNIESYINWGSLLGIYRDNQFIPWDTDIDVSVFWKDREKVILLISELQKLRCFIAPIQECYPEDFWIIRDMQKIELNFLQEINDRIIYSPDRSKLGTPRDIILPFKQIDFRGSVFNIPNQIERYLELSYGKNWKTPLKNVKPKSL